jgi:hypothetical protein
MRFFFTRMAGVVLVVLLAASWLMSGDSLFRLNLHGIRDVAPPLHDGTPWARYLAPEGTCRGDSEAATGRQEQLLAMRCLLDWARRERGLPPLPMSAQLNHAAALKAEAILRCNDFSHTPCGSGFGVTLRAAGWRGGAGENIAWGASLARSPRVLVDGWLHSDGHRENLFRATWRAQGIAFLPAQSFQGEGRAAIWVHELGT